jgi:hypothetical protein
VHLLTSGTELEAMVEQLAVRVLPHTDH